LNASGHQAETAAMAQPFSGAAARLFLCVFLFSMVNVGFWAPALADVIGGLFARQVPADFANRDFANYWMSGRLALSGDLASLWAQTDYQAELESAFGLSGMEPRNWSYPPHLLLLTLPLGWLSYPAAYAVFMAVTGGWFLWTVWAFVQRSVPGDPRTVFAVTLVLLIPFVCLQLLAGQNGFLFGAAMLQGLLWRRSRPVAAGLMFAVLTMKPQLGLLLPLLLLVERRFAAIAWTVIFTGALAGLSVWVFGFSAWVSFFQITAPYQQYVAAHWSGLFLNMMPTWFAAFRAAGVDYGAALTLHACLGLPLVFAALYALLRAPDDMARSRLLLAATFVLTPYGFNYDLGALLALVALELARRADGQNANWTMAFGGGLVMALPLWTPLLGRPDPVLMLPPLVLSGLLMFWAASSGGAFRWPLFIKAGSVP
jgi:hypothetical protein